MIKERDGKWYLYTSDGSKVLGEHDTKEDALKQEAAIKTRESQNHVTLVSNVSKTMIKETDTHFMIRGIPITVNNQTMNSVLYEESEMKKGLPSMVGKPIVLQHPADKDGQFISAMAGDGLMSFFGGGVVTKAYVSNGVSYADAEIKKSLLKAQDNGKYYYDKLSKKKPVGVSTGLVFTDNEESGVDRNGVPYAMKAKDIAFDHLACLPDHQKPAGGDQTMMVFNRRMVTNVNQHIPDEDSFIDKLAAKVAAIFNNEDKTGYNEESPKTNPDMSTNEENEDMKDEDMIAHLKKNGYEVKKSEKNEDDKGDMEKKNMGDKKNMDKKEAKNSAEFDELKSLILAQNSQIEALQTAVNKKEEDKLSALRTNAKSLKVNGLSDSVIDLMTEADLNTLLAANGSPVGNFGTTMMQNHAKETEVMMMPGMEVKK